MGDQTAKCGNIHDIPLLHTENEVHLHCYIMEVILSKYQVVFKNANLRKIRV